MRTWAALWTLAALTGCRGIVIDAGTNVLPEGGDEPEAGSNAASTDDTVSPDDSCSVIEAKSLQIRMRSCAMCHGPPPAPAPQYNWVLDDSKLVSENGPILNIPLVLPGQPSASPMMQRILQGFANEQLGMPPSQTVAGGYLYNPSTIVYLSDSDYSTLYGWILNRVQEPDGGPNPLFDQGGNYTRPSLFYGPGVQAALDPADAAECG